MIHRYGRRCNVPAEFRHDDLRRFVGRPIIDPYRESLLRRCQQPLFLLRFVLAGSGVTDEAISAWVTKELVNPINESLHRIVDHYLSESAEAATDDYDRIELAEQEAVFRLEESRSVDLVGRYDGANSRDRESHRRNFNDFYNPFVLLVSRVGEEGIDLQKQCRYVVHYDLEWNPARMEQREGRVDRVGWGRSGEGFIDVRFMLLKGTYEERIFHTVMQRDQWFQILIGSKRRELGECKDNDAGLGSEAENLASDSEVLDGEVELGSLTIEEKRAVMLDLRPSPAEQCAELGDNGGET